jgi:hypothetical protein
MAAYGRAPGKPTLFRGGMKSAIYFFVLPYIFNGCFGKMPHTFDIITSLPKGFPEASLCVLVAVLCLMQTSTPPTISGAGARHWFVNVGAQA